MPTATSEPPPLMGRLRAATAELHAATEALPLMRALLAERVDSRVYRTYLGAMHGIHLTVEPLLYAHCSPRTLIELGTRPKLAALQRDLARVPDASGWLPRAGWSARMRDRIGDEPAAMGGLYVLEGATLGGQTIARHLRQALEPEAPRALAFLECGLGAGTGAWRRFHAGLERRRVALGCDAAALVDGALTVFASLHEALRLDAR